MMVQAPPHLCVDSSTSRELLVNMAGRPGWIDIRAGDGTFPVSSCSLDLGQSKSVLCLVRNPST